MTLSQGQRKLAATLYPIVGLEGVRYQFRVLRIHERIPEDNYRPIRLQKWADRLWRQVLHCPVYPTSRFAGPAFFIPADEGPLAGDVVEFRDVPDKLYHIEVTDQVFEVSLEEAIGYERELVCRMLERPFSSKLLTLRQHFWKAEWTLFFPLVPENQSVVHDHLNAYRGVKFAVVSMQPGGVYFAADVRTKYVGRKSLLDYTPAERQKLLKEHLDLEVLLKDRAWFIRDNGTIKIPCRYTGETGKTVAEHVFDEATNQTVYTYYRQRYGTLPIKPDEPAIFVQDRRSAPKDLRNDPQDSSLAVPPSRLFPVFSTDHEEWQCSVRPQLTPLERTARINSFLKHLSGVAYDERSIEVQPTYLSKPRTLFLPPRLEFGHGKVLAPFSSPPPSPQATGQQLDSALVRWGSRKLPMLYQAGPFHNEPLRDVIVLYPQSLERPLREQLLEKVAQEINQQTNQRPHWLQQRAYEVGRAERMGSALLRLAAEVRMTHPQCLALVVLWDQFHRSVHGELKETLGPILSQCVTERVVRSITLRPDPSLSTMQNRNLALAVETEAGVKPWVLADDLHYDVYLGIDVLYGRIGYHLLYGKGGRLIERQFGDATDKGQPHEAIKKPTLQRRLEESLRMIAREGHPVRSLVIHRDGRWWPSEGAALRSAIARLKDTKVIPPDARYAVLEIRKNHLPVRLFTAQDEEDSLSLQNPLPGTYLLLDQQRALLSTTGRPGAWDTRRGRTAGTLLLSIADAMGPIDIQTLAEDVYRLTHLNWNAPDIEIGLPVTIRWTDEALRETLISPAKEDEEEEDEEEEWGEVSDNTLIDAEESVL